MRILIKGMDKPESCWRCPLCLTVDPETYRCMPTGKKFGATFDAIDNIVLPCPLVEIPDPKIIAARMQLIKEKTHDEEIAHITADSLMCDLLTELGYGEAVKIFEEMEKWYS